MPGELQGDLKRVKAGRLQVQTPFVDAPLPLLPATALVPYRHERIVQLPQCLATDRLEIAAGRFDVDAKVTDDLVEAHAGGREHARIAFARQLVQPRQLVHRFRIEDADVRKNERG